MHPTILKTISKTCSIFNRLNSQEQAKGANSTDDAAPSDKTHALIDDAAVEKHRGKRKNAEESNPTSKQLVSLLTPPVARSMTKKQRQAAKTALKKAAKRAAFEKKLIRRSNERFFTRGAEHLAAVKKQEECEAALERYRARRWFVMGSKKISMDEDMKAVRRDEAMAMQALAPIQRPLRYGAVQGGGSWCEEENVISDVPVWRSW